jgi:hypothetical protein
MIMGFESIGTAIAMVNGSLELVKKLSTASGAAERAELKLKAAELIGSLADAKLALINSMEEAQTQQRTIAQLQEALQLKATVGRVFDGYYETDANGKPHGDPFCARCWQADHRLLYLTSARRGQMETSCAQCNAKFPKHRTPFAIERLSTAGLLVALNQPVD